MDNVKEASTVSTASGENYEYVVLQVTLKEKLIGTGSGNLTELKMLLISKQKKDIAYTLLPHQMVAVKDLVAEIEYKLQWYLRKSSKIKKALRSNFGRCEREANLV